jgi:hypothetical protein
VLALLARGSKKFVVFLCFVGLVGPWESKVCCFFYVVLALAIGNKKYVVLLVNCIFKLATAGNSTF